MFFKNLQDKKFFINLLSNGDVGRFKKSFSKYFDFRDPVLKRKEFNLSKNTWIKSILKKRGVTCQLKISPKCHNEKLVLDHMIPLSTNELNKHFRKMKAKKGKKVPTQSFGANHESNFLLACEACNSLKKHRFVKKINGRYVLVQINSQRPAL